MNEYEKLNYNSTIIVDSGYVWAPYIPVLNGTIPHPESPRYPVCWQCAQKIDFLRAWYLERKLMANEFKRECELCKGTNEWTALVHVPDALLTIPEHLDIIGV